MTQEKDERIKARAHEIWESEGRPDGRHDEHWQRAKQEIGSDLPSEESAHPGMFGDGTEEQNLNQTGDTKARITEEEVQEAFQSVKQPVKGRS